MPHLTLPVSPAGCEIDVLVGVSTARRSVLIAAKRPIPQSIQIRMIIDTGATDTAIDESALKALGLTPTGTTEVLTPSTRGTPVTLPNYDVSIAIYHAKSTLAHNTIPVIASDFAGQGIQGLLGCDVLQQCLLIYDGVAATFTLSF